MKDWIDITVVLDKSGSMNVVRAETISGYNKFVKEQVKAGKNASLTLVTFDSNSIDKPEQATRIDKVKQLSKHTYIPGALTPLYDALGVAMTDAGNRLSAIPEAERPDKVLFVIITDGLENASTEYTREKINQMISHQTNVYNWQFMYLRANADEWTAEAEAQGLGIPLSNTSNYTNSSTLSMYSTVSAKSAAYRVSGSGQSLGITAEEREELNNEPEPQQ